jgi:hypothetical protein
MIEVEKITIKVVKKGIMELTPGKCVSSMKDFGPKRVAYFRWLTFYGPSNL